MAIPLAQTNYNKATIAKGPTSNSDVNMRPALKTLLPNLFNPPSTTPRVGVSSPSALGIPGLITPPKTTAGVPTSNITNYTPPVAQQPVNTTANPNYNSQVAAFANAPQGTPMPQQPVQQAQPAPTPPPGSALAPSGVQGIFANTAQSLSNLGSGVNQISQESYSNANKTLEDIKNLKLTAADQTAQYYNMPIAGEYGAGYAQNLQRQYNDKLNALSGIYGAQAGLVGAGTEQQSAQGNILNNVLGATAPESNFPYVFDPATSSYTTPGVNGGSQQSGIQLTYDPQKDSQTLADQVINHQISYDDAVKGLGYAGSTAEALLQQAVLGKGGNISVLRAQGTVQGQQATQKENYKSALKQSQNLGSQLTDLITSSGVNPSDINKTNALLQTIARNTSDPRYMALLSYITDLSSTFSQVLNPDGGSPTDYARSLAGSLLDSTAKGQSLITQIKVLEQQAQAKIDKIETVTPNGSSGSGSTASAGGYTFQQDDKGKWVSVSN